MRSFPVSPLEIVASLRRHQGLIRASIRREVLGRYRGSFMGLLWSFITPVLMLTIYTFVFGTVFGARWGTASTSTAEFSLLLFAGLIVFNIYSDCVSRAPTLILGNPNYVKKVVFPLETLPLTQLGASLFQGLINTGVWLIAYFIFIGPPHATAALFPLVLLPFVLFIAGLSWALASIGVYLRDINQLIGVSTTALMFMSPIFYPVTALPENYRSWLYLNPLTTVIEQSRDVLFWGKLPDSSLLIYSLLISAIIAWLGFALFQKTRRGFSDVI